MRHRCLIAVIHLAAAWGLLLTGCAGGWRNGAPPGAGSQSEGSATSTTAGASKTAAGPSAGASSAAASTDGVVFAWKGEAKSVNLAGEFNAWNTSSDPLTRQADGSWSITKKLDPGRYKYKFVIDGGTWKEDPAAKETADDGFGGKNSVIVVGSGATGSTAASSTSGSMEANAAAAAAPSGKGKAPVPSTDGVRFTFAGAANTVHLAGDFNSWSTTADPLTKQPDGTWTITKKLEPGTYGYKFVVNGTTWKQDDANPEAKDDGFGGKNSVVTVK